MKNGKILIIDDNEDVLFALNLLLEPYVEQIKVTTQPERIEHFMSTFVPDVILLDMNFRQDLLYRINTIELHIPPLRERGNDILLLADYFLDCYARKYKKKIGGLTRDAKTKLQSYAWPGNVRELQHAIERAVILSDGPMLRPENFMLHPAPAQKKGEPEELNLGVLEKEAIERALRRADGNITRAAELLGITRFALYRKLDKLGL